MAELFTGLDSFNWSQEDVQKYFLEPLFVSNNSLEHFDVMTDISGVSIKLDRYSALKGITKNQTLTGFSADDTQSTNSNIVLTLSRLEVEHKQSAFSMFNHIKSQLLKQGINRNDISGTKIMEIVSALILGGIQRDFSSILWWGDTENGGGADASPATANAPYTLTNGIWKQMSEQVVAGTAGGGQVTVQPSTGSNQNALGSLEAMVAARSVDLAAQPNVIWCSHAFAEDYKAQLRNAGTHTQAYADLQGGFQSLSFDGIPMKVMPEWDVDIAANGGNMAEMDGGLAPNAAAEKKCAILTMPGNFTVATDFNANPVDMWYNRDEKENRFRMNYSFGCAIKEPTMWVSNTVD